MLDYNLVICGLLGLGYPLLYDFNQTEDSLLSSGDTLFLPGSLISGGVREQLVLRHWTPAGMRRYDRSGSLFVPYADAEWDGGHMPLTCLHRQQAAGSTGQTDYHSSLHLREHQRISELLSVLVERAGTDERALTQIFDRAVHRDGRVERTVLRRNGSGYILGRTTYPSVAALVEASFIPAQVAKAEGPLDDILPEVPESVPLLSIDMVVLFYAALGCHRLPGHPALCGHFDLHIQWGALAMGGSPPQRGGYFARRAGRMRRLYETGMRELPWLTPVIFIIAPVAPFLLWPSSRVPRDAELVDALLGRVLSATAKRHHADDATAVIQEAMAQWQAGEGMQISEGFWQQLQWSSRLSRSGDRLSAGVPQKPARFDSLTMSQACQIVGILTKEMS